MRTCRGGKRWQEVSRLLHYLARRSSLIRQKSGHNFHHSPVIGRIHNFASFPWNSGAISSPSWLWRSRCYVGKLSAIPTPDCFKAVFCSELWAHFYARCIRAALRHRPSVAVQLWSEEKKKRRSAWMKYPAPQLPCRLPTRTCQLLLDQHPHDWKITTLHLQTLTQMRARFA